MIKPAGSALRLYLSAPLAEWGVIQMCCSTAPFQVRWICSVEFCLIFSTFSVPASAAVNFWSIFHQRKWCCLQLWFDFYSCQTEALIESSESVQLLHMLRTGKAANSASRRTFPGTPSSSVTPSLQTSPSTSKIEQDRWGNRRMVIVTSKRSSSCLPCSSHQSAHHHCYCRSGSWWPEARSAAVHCTVPARHLTFSGSEYLRQSLASVKGEAAQDLSKLCPWCWHLPIRNLSELISVFHQAASSTSSSPKFPLWNAKSVVLKMRLIFSFLLRHLYVIPHHYLLFLSSKKLAKWLMKRHSMNALFSSNVKTVSLSLMTWQGLKYCDFCILSQLRWLPFVYAYIKKTRLYIYKENW